MKFKFQFWNDKFTNIMLWEWWELELVHGGKGSEADDTFKITINIDTSNYMAVHKNKIPITHTHYNCI